MKDVLLTKRFLNDYKYHSKSRESINFTNDKYYLKLLKKEILLDDREKVIKRLEEVKHENAVIPEFLVHDKKGFQGFSMINYKDYDYISSVISNDLFDINKDNDFLYRKELMLRLIKIIEFFKSKEFAYYDIYDKNILYKDGDIKIIDMDSGIFKGLINCEYDYDSSIRFANHLLSVFALSFLYNTYYLRFVSNVKPILNSLNNYLNEDLKKFYSYVFRNEFHLLLNPYEMIDSIDENIYRDTIDIIRKRLIN